MTVLPAVLPRERLWEHLGERPEHFYQRGRQCLVRERTRSRSGGQGPRGRVTRVGSREHRV